MENLKYCLYARKSSESDERQAMSIDSQLKEMKELAVKEGLNVTEIKQESHSAKASSTRPYFLEMISEITIGKYNAILTWAPDRLSRNAGDLGSLVDLMDKGKLLHIRTFGQTFSNTPNEKFLLMILCSQAKLENDNKGVNVKRGIRNKCEMGWRPGPAPLGYFNRSYNGVKDIIPDPETSPIVKQMFELVGYKGLSGRALKKWLDHETPLRTRKNKKLPLSMIYIMLKNSFYYGEFEYPLKSGKWYKGSQKPLIPKELFDIVQEKLIVPPKSPWNSKEFAFTRILKCGTCGASITAEERYKNLKDGTRNKYIYYHCTKPFNTDFKCTEPYIREEDLIPQIAEIIEKTDIDEKQISSKLNEEFKRFNKFSEMLNVGTEALKSKPDLKTFAKHILLHGTSNEKREVAGFIKNTVYLKSQRVFIE